MSQMMERLRDAIRTHKTDNFQKYLSANHLYMEELLKIASRLLEANREYYKITRFSLQSDEYGIKWLYGETPTTTEKITNIEFPKEIGEVMIHFRDYTSKSLFHQSRAMFEKDVDRLIHHLVADIRDGARAYAVQRGRPIPEELKSFPEGTPIEERKAVINNFMERMDDTHHTGRSYYTIFVEAGAAFFKFQPINLSPLRSFLEKNPDPAAWGKSQPPQVRIELLEFRKRLVYYHFIFQNEIICFDSLDKIIDEKRKKGINRLDAEMSTHPKALEFINNTVEKLNVELSLSINYGTSSVSYYRLNDILTDFEPHITNLRISPRLRVN